MKNTNYFLSWYVDQRQSGWHYSTQVKVAAVIRNPQETAIMGNFHFNRLTCKNIAFLNCGSKFVSKRHGAGKQLLIFFGKPVINRRELLKSLPPINYGIFAFERIYKYFISLRMKYHRLWRINSSIIKIHGVAGVRIVGLTAGNQGHSYHAVRRLAFFSDGQV